MGHMEITDWIVLLGISATFAATILVVRLCIAQSRPLTTDSEPHLLVILGPDGRPNPARYETFPDYPQALQRQRRLWDMGQPARVSHLASGQCRPDAALWFQSYMKICL